MSQVNTPVKVDLIGANQRLRDTLAMIFDGPMKGICEFSDGFSASAVIVDLDGVGAHAQWEEYRNKNPGRPSIVLSVKAIEVPNAHAVLVKPIKVNEFRAAVEHVANDVSRGQAEKKPKTGAKIVPADTTPITVSVARVTEVQTASIRSDEPSTQTMPVLAQDLEDSITKPLEQPSTPRRDFKEVCGDAEDIDCENPEQVSSILMSLDNRLLGVVLKAISESDRQQVPVTISLKQKQLFVLYPGQQLSSLKIKDDLLQCLCAYTFSADSFELKLEPDLLLDMDDPSTVTKEGMLWKIAVWTYCGKLPQDTRLQERVYLRHWPNLTRLLELPDAMRISALLADQPMLLVRAAEALGIPQRHVFTYYSAAYTIGLMGGASRNSDYLLEPPDTPPEHTNRKLLGRMMRHLRKLLS